MDKYINKLLDANNRVIVPDFGAFIVKQLHPRTIVFNEFLRYNDGLLVDLLADEEKLDKETARQKIVDYVEDMNKKIDKGQKFTIPSLGTLAKEANGKISFVEPSDSVQEKTNEQKITEEAKKTKDITLEQNKPKAAEKPSDKKAEPVKESKKEETKSPVKTMKPEIEPGEKKEEIKKEEKKPEVTAQVKKEEPKTEEKETEKKAPPQSVTSKTETTVKAGTNKISPPEPEVKKPVTTEKPGATVLDKPVEPAQPVKYERRNSKTQIFILVALIVVVNGAIIYWFFFNDKVTGIFQHNDTELRQDEPEKPKEPAVTITPKQTEQVNTKETTTKDLKTNTNKENKVSGPPFMPPKPKPAAKKVTVSNGKTYYIVAGCFKDEANADKLVKELQDKGYNAVKFGKIGQLYAVSYGSFPDKASANNELVNIKKNIQSDVWIVAR
jgi:hypothetical protein